jgi:hypothetical protein
MEGFGVPGRASVWCLGVPFQSKSQKAISCQLFFLDFFLYWPGGYLRLCSLL